MWEGAALGTLQLGGVAARAAAPLQWCMQGHCWRWLLGGAAALDTTQPVLAGPVGSPAQGGGLGPASAQAMEAPQPLVDSALTAGTKSQLVTSPASVALALPQLRAPMLECTLSPMGGEQTATTRAAAPPDTLQGLAGPLEGMAAAALLGMGLEGEEQATMVEEGAS